MTRYQLHVRDWGECRRCSYADHRRNVCLVRGAVAGRPEIKLVFPADVLFVGQAPGISENATGFPFEGPAGILMDAIVTAAFGTTSLCADCDKSYTTSPDGKECPGCGALGRPLRWAFTNLVGCIPPTDEYGKEGEPDHEAIEACRPRLQEIIDIVNPRLLVRVGAFARKWVTPGFKASVKVPDGCKVIDMDHPGSMLPGRVAQAQRGLLVQRAEVTLSQAVEDL